MVNFFQVSLNASCESFYPSLAVSVQSSLSVKGVASSESIEKVKPHTSNQITKATQPKKTAIDDYFDIDEFDDSFENFTLWPFDKELPATVKIPDDLRLVGISVVIVDFQCA